MKRRKNLTQLGTVAMALCIIPLLMSCQENSSSNATKTEPEKNQSNPVVYFEIPVTDVDRASAFYTSVFHFNFEKDTLDGNEMAFFPFHEKKSGISGALAKGEIYKPTRDGVLLYFKTENIDETLQLATAQGAKVLFPKTDNGIGLVAEFEDTEGNRIALYQSKDQ